MFLRNVSWHSTDYTALYPRRWCSSVWNLLLLLLLPSPLPSTELLNSFKSLRSIQIPKLFWTFFFFCFWRYRPWRTLAYFTIALHRPAAIVKGFSTFKAFYGVEPSTPSPTPNLEAQCILFCLDHHLWPVQHGRLYQQLHYRRHSSQDHMTTQAPPLRRSRDTDGGILDYLLLKYLNNLKETFTFWAWHLHYTGTSDYLSWLGHQSIYC
jgi:hypothetical protein